MRDARNVPLLDAPANGEPRITGPQSVYEGIDGEEEPNLRAYWGAVQKRRWTILSVVLATLTLVLIATLKEKPVYRAAALLEIEKENANIVSVQELFQLENVSDNYLQTQYKILQSESLARRVIDKLHLEQADEFRSPTDREHKNTRVNARGKEFAPPPAERQEAILRKFEVELNIKPVAESRLVRISFDSQDPALAATIVNSLTENFIQQNLETRWEAAQKASEWLSEQLKDMRAKLEKSENELQGYAQSNGLLFLETDKGKAENLLEVHLRQLQDELTQVQADRYQKESVYRQAQAGEYASLPGVYDSKVMQDLTVKLADLQAQKDTLTTSYTTGSPKVMQLQNAMQGIERTLTQEQSHAVKKITDDYLAAVRRETLVREAFEKAQKHENLLAGRAVQYNILKREADTNKQLYEGLLQRLKEAGVSAGLKASNIRIVDPAVPPTKPVKPIVLLNLSLALLLGLVSGVGIASLQEHLDNTVKTPNDVERLLHLPALAIIPSRHSLSQAEEKRRRGGLKEISLARLRGRLPMHGTNGEKDRWYRMDAELEPNWSLREAFRGLRTSVMLSTADRPPRSLVIVSAAPGEGKTTICCNLAIALAQLGKYVLLVDGDMRRPSLHKIFLLRKTGGLASYLAGQEQWQDEVQTTAVPGLDCLVCGPVPPNPSELLSSERMQALFRDAVSAYQFVLIDSPPLLHVADGRILSSISEGAILVVRGEATPRELVQRAGVHLRHAGARLIGVVLNAVDFHREGYYSGYYNYGYKYYADATENEAVKNEKKALRQHA